MSGETILVVDDDKASSKLARVVLQREGYEVRTAADAEDALAMLASLAPSLILMDVHLPGLDGLALTRRLKSAAATRDIVILAVTASATKRDEESALAAGCNGYLTKPIDTRSLPKFIADCLAAGRATS